MIYNFQFFYNFINFFVVLILSILISIILIYASYIINLKKNDFEKLSAYECGFKPFEDTKINFNLHFYLVSILFILFDLEIVYFFPWFFSLSFFSFFCFFNGFIFLFILTLGLVYEWIYKALDWTDL